MTVPFTGLDAQKQRLRSGINAAIAAVIDHGNFIMGPEVAIFERQLASFCGSAHAVSVANGTDALQISLMALGLKAGDRVFVPSFTYTATAEVIIVLGGIPIFVDVDPTTFNIDCDDLCEKIARENNRGNTLFGVIAVDLFGLPAEWSRLNEICQDEGLRLIADAAQSFGAINADGRHVGTLAPVTTTSFFPAKPLGCYGDGGAIFTEDSDLAEVLRSIRVHGAGAAKYETVRVGMNSRLDTLQAAILIEKLAVFAEEISRREALARYYSKHLTDSLTVPSVPNGVTSAWAQYTILSEAREALQAHLLQRGVPTAIYYPQPMHLQPAYAEYGDGAGTLPISERLSKEVLSLPMSPYWTEEHAEIVIESVNDFQFEKASASAA